MEASGDWRPRQAHKGSHEGNSSGQNDEQGFLYIWCYGNCVVRVAASADAPTLPSLLRGADVSPLGLQVSPVFCISHEVGVILSQWLLYSFNFRYFEFRSWKAELFMLDFCYFMNLSVSLQTLGWPDNLAWFQANYALSMGPVFLSIIAWKLSLVFHSLNKVWAVFLHTFPAIICHAFR